MLTPSCEATILQEMDFHENDNVLLIGNGSGHLAECISHLSSSVAAYECNDTLMTWVKKTWTLTASIGKDILFNKNIFNFLDKMHDHTKVIFTCSVRSYDFFVDYLSENSKTLHFYGKISLPIAQE